MILQVWVRGKQPVWVLKDQPDMTQKAQNSQNALPSGPSASLTIMLPESLTQTKTTEKEEIDAAK